MSDDSGSDEHPDTLKLANKKRASGNVNGELIERLQAARYERANLLLEQMVEPDISVVQDNLIDLYDEIVSTLSSNVSISRECAKHLKDALETAMNIEPTEEDGEFYQELKQALEKADAS